MSRSGYALNQWKETGFDYWSGERCIRVFLAGPQHISAKIDQDALVINIMKISLR